MEVKKCIEIFVQIHVYMYIGKCVHTYIYIYGEKLWMAVKICTVTFFVRKYSYIYVCIYVHTYIYIYIWIEIMDGGKNVYRNICTYTYMYIDKYVHTYIYLYIIVYLWLFSLSLILYMLSFLNSQINFGHRPFTIL
jgi:hypothetical protein